MSASSSPASAEPDSGSGSAADTEMSARSASSSDAPSGRYREPEDAALAADLIITHIHSTHEASRRDIGTLSQALLAIMRSLEDLREIQGASARELRKALTASLTELDQNTASLSDRIKQLEAGHKALEATMNARFEADSAALRRLSANVAVSVERISEVAAVIGIPPGTCVVPPGICAAPMPAEHQTG